MKMTFRWYGQSDGSHTAALYQADPQHERRCQFLDGYARRGSVAHGAYSGAEARSQRRRSGAGGSSKASISTRTSSWGLPSRDEYIDNYRQIVARLGQAGVKVICYNFMPVFDWTRTDLAKPRFDGATVLAYDQSIIDCITDPQAFADRIQQGAGDFEMAGWEPERMAELKKLFAQYASVSHEDLFRNLQYFLKAVIPRV